MGKVAVGEGGILGKDDERGLKSHMVDRYGLHHQPGRALARLQCLRVRPALFSTSYPGRSRTSTAMTD
ncbi:unnamed protein product [Periconia digitata]|uniref:Uncharacterized protein n=1 Tax=Periconia digitata TaxID=1303443 RepID=A0A9W4XX75_9PLEO|nr:unnamed protein product [Periconia digitata]